MSADAQVHGLVLRLDDIYLEGDTPSGPMIFPGISVVADSNGFTVLAPGSPPRTLHWSHLQRLQRIRDLTLPDGRPVTAFRITTADHNVLFMIPDERLGTGDAEALGAHLAALAAANAPSKPAGSIGAMPPGPVPETALLPSGRTARRAQHKRQKDRSLQHTSAVVMVLIAVIMTGLIFHVSMAQANGQSNLLSLASSVPIPTQELPGTWVPMQSKVESEAPLLQQPADDQVGADFVSCTHLSQSKAQDLLGIAPSIGSVEDNPVPVVDGPPTDNPMDGSTTPSTMMQTLTMGLPTAEVSTFPAILADPSFSSCYTTLVTHAVVATITTEAHSGAGLYPTFTSQPLTVQVPAGVTMSGWTIDMKISLGRQPELFFYDSAFLTDGHFEAVVSVFSETERMPASVFDGIVQTTAQRLATAAPQVHGKIHLVPFTGKQTIGKAPTTTTTAPTPATTSSTIPGE